MLMNKLNHEFKGGKLSMAIRYLKRYLSKAFPASAGIQPAGYGQDGLPEPRQFFTGVSEGVISSDRIIKMLNVKDDHVTCGRKRDLLDRKIPDRPQADVLAGLPA
jgi:hypothetical protein